MAEIVRMTTQMQPLQVGIPLYPFSRHTAFERPGNANASIITPLPTNAYDEDSASTAGSPSSWNASPPVAYSVADLRSKIGV